MLATFGEASQVDSGVIEVRMTAVNSRRRIRVVITPEQWNDLIDTPWGNIDGALAYVREAVGDLGTHHRFLVYETLGLVASDSPTLAVDPAELEIEH